MTVRTFKGMCGRFRRDGAVLAYQESNRIQFLDLVRNEPLDFAPGERFGCVSSRSLTLASSGFPSVVSAK